MKIIPSLLCALLSLTLIAGEPAVTTPPAKPDPAALLKSMQTFCGGLNTLACEISFVRTARSPGKTSERFANFDVAFQRPNLLSILLKDEGRVTYAWIGDGKDVYTYMSGVEKYSKNPSPATLAELLGSPEVYVVRNALEGAFPLNELLAGPSADGKLPFDATSAEYVALEELGTDKAHHVRVKRKPAGFPADWDLWIADGPAPLPVKITSDLSADPDNRKANMSVNYVAEFKRWLPGAELDARAFKFDPSSAAKRVGGFLPEIPPHPLLNQPAPAATIQLLGGKTVNLAAHKGRDVVVLDFWAIACVPCIGLLPKVDAVAKKYAGQNVVFYALNEDDSEADIREFFKLQGITLNAALHNKAANFAKFKVDTIPQTVVIDKNGVIRAVHTVHSTDLAADLTTLIEQLK